MEQENEFRFKRVQRGRARVGPRVLPEERATQAIYERKRQKTYFLWHPHPRSFLSALQIQLWGVGPTPEAAELIQLCLRTPARVPWVRLCGSSRRHKVIARFGTKCSHSVKIGLRRRMKQRPGKNHFANRLPRRISLLKSSVQKFTP